MIIIFKKRRSPGGGFLPAPAEIHGACIHLVEDIVQDLLLFKSRRKIIITQGGFDLSDYIAYIGHGFFGLLFFAYTIRKQTLYIAQMGTVFLEKRVDQGSNL
jgi:hypothetical protein